MFTEKWWCWWFRKLGIQYNCQAGSGILMWHCRSVKNCSVYLNKSSGIVIFDVFFTGGMQNQSSTFHEATFG